MGSAVGELPLHVCEVLDQGEEFVVFECDERGEGCFD